MGRGDLATRLAPPPLWWRTDWSSMWQWGGGQRWSATSDVVAQSTCLPNPYHLTTLRHVPPERSTLFPLPPQTTFHQSTAQKTPGNTSSTSLDTPVDHLPLYLQGPHSSLGGYTHDHMSSLGLHIGCWILLLRGR